MTDIQDPMTPAAEQVRPYDAAAADALDHLAAVGMHPKSAMRRVRALADTAKPAARGLLHDLADDLNRVPAGPEDIDVQVAAIRRAIGAES